MSPPLNTLDPLTPTAVPRHSVTPAPRAGDDGAHAPFAVDGARAERATVLRDRGTHSGTAPTGGQGRRGLCGWGLLWCLTPGVSVGMDARGVVSTEIKP